jgi:hypothetical protein
LLVLHTPPQLVVTPAETSVADETASLESAGTDLNNTRNKY